MGAVRQSLSLCVAVEQARGDVVVAIARRWRRRW